MTPSEVRAEVIKAVEEWNQKWSGTPLGADAGTARRMSDHIEQVTLWAIIRILTILEEMHAGQEPERQEGGAGEAPEVQAGAQPAGVEAPEEVRQTGVE